MLAQCLINFPCALCPGPNTAEKEGEEEGGPAIVSFQGHVQSTTTNPAGEESNARGVPNRRAGELPCLLANFSTSHNPLKGVLSFALGRIFRESPRLNAGMIGGNECRFYP